MTRQLLWCRQCKKLIRRDEKWVRVFLPVGEPPRLYRVHAHEKCLKGWYDPHIRQAG